MPVRLVALGVIGCPDEIVMRDVGAMYGGQRFTYANDRLDGWNVDNVTLHFEWDGDVPRYGGDKGFVRSAGRIEHTIIEHHVWDVDAEERPLRWYRAEKAGELEEHGELVWQGERLVVIRRFDRDDRPSDTIELVYDCRDLPPRP